MHHGPLQRLLDAERGNETTPKQEHERTTEIRDNQYGDKQVLAELRARPQYNIKRATRFNPVDCRKCGATEREWKQRLSQACYPRRPTHSEDANNSPNDDY